jgi:hypothetical protein
MLLSVDCWRKHGLTGEDAITVATTWVLRLIEQGSKCQCRGTPELWHTPRNSGNGLGGVGSTAGDPWSPINSGWGFSGRQAEAGYTVSTF